ncbi:MAG: FHA domain-containing protein [Planctomycetaceae bacterium]|nr:FHA domain-containing protein [Planctomycetaceae bacterium]MBT6154593.1 FHA domain-containing protein [Planctomycetaceae bacterium]MBT6487203.1 FHA domain-containing protein [Planctomycetaceae bacterium]MBT6498037.1 FHA domain-containing protein [Planctomycetaceae bacterium]
MNKRKTILQSTDEPIPISEIESASGEIDGDDFEMTLKDSPDVAIPSARPSPRQTVATPQSGARQTMAERPSGARQTMVERRSAADAIPFRSVNRPPTGLLIALDDASSDRGEEWRIRRSRVIIGRTEGDIVIPHDIDMSGEHAEISRNEKDGGYEWQLKDLKSTNGTFLRAQRFVLRNGKELLLGGRRYQFRHPGVIADAAAAYGGRDARVTQPYQPPPSNVAQQLTARLVELTTEGDGREFLLGNESSLFGSDSSSCLQAVSGDPFLDPEHARFYQDNRGRWVVEDRDSLNGLWVRVERVTLDRASEFQLGGQRFRFRIP